MKNTSAIDVHSLQLSELSSSLEGLPELSIADLRILWHRLCRRKSTPPTKVLLMHSLAWHAQALAEQSLDAQTRSLINKAQKSARVRKGEGLSPQDRSKQEQARPAIHQGTKLVRKWGGQTHEVLYQGKAYLYREKHYRSLSQIAREITGAHWSGPRFFGIN